LFREEWFLTHIPPGILMPAEAPCALQWLGCGNATRRFQHVVGDVSFLMLETFYPELASSATSSRVRRVS
jgi:hypothetical protein